MALVGSFTWLHRRKKISLSPHFQYFFLPVFARYPKHEGDRMINYYSSSRVVDSDGDRTGNEQADNARVLSERRFAVSIIGREDVQCGEWGRMGKKRRHRG